MGWQVLFHRFTPLGRRTSRIVVAPSSPYVVTVTGPTGKTGRHVAAEATARGWRVRAAGRHRPAVGEWVPFDWDDRDSWTRGFLGSDAAYVVIPFNHPGAPQKAPHVLEAAADGGVSRIVLLSTLDAEHAPVTDPARITERALQELDVSWTILRPTWFLDNFTTGSFAAMTAAGELRLPAGEGRIPFIDARDVAAVAAAALARDGPRGTLPLTGPEAVSHGEVAAALSEVLGRRVRYTSVTADEFVGLMTSRGFPRAYGEFLAEALVGVAEGRLRIPVSDTVERVTGRPARSVRDFARAGS
jgi:uncharacterized protein YbjT (DUF2867 family)